MSDRITLDVIDRPLGGVLRFLTRLRTIRSGRAQGLRALLALGTTRFVTRSIPALTPRRIAILAAWDDDGDVDPRWSETFGELCSDAKEHWHVEAEVVRAAFTEPWKGWTPDVTDARPLDPGEPALIMISGNLRARYIVAFNRDIPGAVGHAFTQPGYLGGLGIASSALNTTSCSCWRTYQEAANYAYKSGVHADVMQRDRARRQHRTEYFLRLRPLAERGTLAGTAPFASLLSPLPVQNRL